MIKNKKLFLILIVIMLAGLAVIPHVGVYAANSSVDTANVVCSG